MEEEAMFCAACGARIEEEEKKEQAPWAFCSNCGEKLEEEVLFCPNCGMNQQTGEGGAAKRKEKSEGGFPLAKLLGDGKTKKIALGIAVCFVCVLVIRLAGNVFASPARKFVAGQKKALQEDVLDYVFKAAEIYNAYSNLSTDITLTGNSENTDIGNYLEDTSIGLNVDLGDDSALVNANLTILGSKVLTADLTYDQGKAGFCIPELDDTYYTLDLEMAEPFLPYYLDGISGLENREIPVDTMKKLADKYLSLILKAANKENVTRADQDSFRQEYMGDKVKGTKYIFQPSADEIEEIVLKLADTIEKDKELRRFILDMQKTILGYAVFGGPSEDSESEIDERLRDICSDMRDDAEYIAGVLEGVRWTMGTSGKTVCMQKIGSSDGGFEFGYETADGITAFFASSYGDRWSLEVEREGRKGEEEGGIRLYHNEMQMAGLTFRDMDADKKSALEIPYGSYEMSVFIGDVTDAEEYSVEIDVEKGEDGGTDHTVLVESWPQDWVSQYAEGLELTLNTSDKASTASKPKSGHTDISDYTDEETYELLYGLDRMADEIFRDADLSFLGYLW